MCKASEDWDAFFVSAALSARGTAEAAVPTSQIPKCAPGWRFL